MSYLLDTNVVSEVRKRKPDPNVRAWLNGVPSFELHLSALVLGELRKGIEGLRRRDPKAADSHESWLGTLIEDYADRIVTIDAAIAEQWGRMNAERTLPVIDGLMAATAKVKGWTFVTRNVTDVEGTDIAVLDPWSP